MSPRKSAKSLYSISLQNFVKYLTKYIDQKTFKLNFFNDFEAASKEFLERSKKGIENLDDHFVGPLR